MWKRRIGGASLVEVLVVIVILVVGIFSIVRLFPGGFLVLERGKEQAMAAQLNKQMLERLKGRLENLPEGIYPVKYTLVGGRLVLEVDPETRPDDLGYWETDDPNLMGQIDPHYTSDVNRIRRIVGESLRIPAPKPVGSDSTDPRYIGGLYQVQFAPILYDPRVFVVYSTPLQRRWVSRNSHTDPVPIGRVRRMVQEYYLDPNLGAIWLPVSPTQNITYKVDVSVWVVANGRFERHDYIDIPLTTDPSMLVSADDFFPPPPALNAITGIDLKPLIVQSGEEFHSIIWNSVRVARTFSEIPVDADWNPDDPYQYKMLNYSLGLVLFNPAGYDFRELRNRQMVPLQATFNYDVLDWHIIVDERRVGDRAPYNVKLTLDRIKRIGDLNNDNTRFQGINLQFDGRDHDVLIVDVADGSVIVNRPNRQSFDFDALKGIVRLADEVLVLRPDSTEELRSPAGRTYRFMYMGHDDWGVQVQKAPATYNIVYGLPASRNLGIRQAYVPSDRPGTRIYFPQCDLGKRVVVQEYRYIDRNGSRQVGRSEDFVILAPRAGDDIQLPYIDIADDAHHPDADRFDFESTGSPVDAITGVSLKVRVVWAPTQRERSAEARANSYPNLRFLPMWRKIDFDTHLTREVAD